MGAGTRAGTSSAGPSAAEDLPAVTFSRVLAPAPQAGIPQGRQATDADEAATECAVCLAEPSDGPDVELFAPLPCKHTACVTCWTQYLTVRRHACTRAVLRFRGAFPAARRSR